MSGFSKALFIMAAALTAWIILGVAATWLFSVLM